MDRTGRIRTIRQGGLRTSSRSPTSAPRNTKACHHGLEGRCVSRLAGNDAVWNEPSSSVGFLLRPAEVAGILDRLTAWKRSALPRALISGGATIRSQRR